MTWVKVGFWDLNFSKVRGGNDYKKKMSYRYSPSRSPNIANAGGSRNSKKKNKNDNFYSTTVICGTCNNTAKAYSIKHGRYICPLCDEGGEELLFPINEEMKQQQQDKTPELPDIDVKYSTTDGHSMDKPSSLNSSSYHYSSTSSSGRTKAVYKSSNDRRRRRKPDCVNSEFDRVLKAQDEQLQRSGGTITSDRIVRRQSHDIL
jgi:hypothetical protein